MGQKRKKTKYTNIYYNENTQKYDVKYNYKVYNPKTAKNDYKSKWIYNLNTLAEARQELAKLQTGENKAEDKDITLAGAYDLWEIEARAENYSVVTIDNTKQHMNMIYQFISKDSKIKDLTEDDYYNLIASCRDKKYSDETIHSINSTFRKLINLCFRKRLVQDNFLARSKNPGTKKRNEESEKIEYRLVKYEEFEKIVMHIKKNKVVKLGVDTRRKYLLMTYILYYTGIRLGECLALKYSDFEEFNYYPVKDRDNLPPRLVPRKEEMDPNSGEHLRGWRMNVRTAYLSRYDKTKGTKNKKSRSIPLYADLERIFLIFKNEHLQAGGSLEDKLFDIKEGAVREEYRRLCELLEIPHLHPHDFRHTFISNLISKGVPIPVIEKVSGDTQRTILERYSHMIESDEQLVLTALSKINK